MRIVLYCNCVCIAQVLARMPAAARKEFAAHAAWAAAASQGALAGLAGFQDSDDEDDWGWM